MTANTSPDQGKPLFEEDVEFQVKMPWPVICKAAVVAACRNISLNEIVNEAIARKLGATKNV